uniref:AMP-dependent synthetase/ligase domain-containing protein n=1 Tax=Salix viminalis TaxID=40686 RepID=A0A6N2LRH7_SALVM
MNHFFKNHKRLTSTFNIFGSSNFSKRSRALFSSFASDLLEPDSWKSMEGLVRCKANYAPLSPISFLERSATVYRERTSVIYGSLKFTWAETHQRCLKLASALSQLGISRGDVVAVLAPNVPAMYELHFAVPMAGAVFCTLNTRHDSNMVSILLKHSEAKIIFVDHQLLDIARGALDLLEKTGTKPPMVVLISESDGSSPTGSSSSMDSAPESEWIYQCKLYFWHNVKPKELFIATGEHISTPLRPFSFMALAQCLFTSGLCHVSLQWMVPHLGMAAQGGTNVCLRKVTPKDIFDRIDQHKVTHMAGAPTVLSMIVNSEVRDRKILLTKGAPHPSNLFQDGRVGFWCISAVWLTETYGQGLTAQLNDYFLSMKIKDESSTRVQHLGLEDVDIKDPVTMESVPADGKTIGEIMFRGNTVMSGYLKDLKATEDAFSGGWFRSGDLAVKHSDGYIEVKDRAKDIVITGGENVCTLEVETVLYNHPAILEAAVVGRPDDFWGQTPCAFVKLKEGFDVDAQDIIKFCQDHLPHYMAPKTVVLRICRETYGKVQKFILREKAKALPL